MDAVSPANDSRGLEVVTFGCRLNAAESEFVRLTARAAGVEEAIIVNTCAVTTEAVRQARQTIRRRRRARPDARLIVTGCAAQIEPAAFAAMAEADLVLGNAEKLDVRAFAPGAARVQVADIALQGRAIGAVSAGGEKVRVCVEIQNGCDHRCTFCVIPFGRGRSRSVEADVVVERVRAAVAGGAREVALTGVDLTSWGADLAGAPPLGRLVATILARVPELPRLRLSSLDAAEIDDELLSVLGRERRLMPHLHLSLQSGDDLVLKRMKRRHRRADAVALAHAVRAARPDIALGADFIVGFPTESEAAFEGTVRLVEEAALSFLHVFPFSARPGTPAARMPPVAGLLIRRRAERLRAIAAAARARHLEALRGRRVRALVERPGLARAEDFTEIAFQGAAPLGAIIAGAIGANDGRRAFLAAWARAA